MTEEIIISAEGWVPTLWQWGIAILITTIIVIYLSNIAFKYIRKQEHIVLIGTINTILFISIAILAYWSLGYHGKYPMYWYQFGLRAFLWACPIALFSALYISIIKRVG